MLYSHTPVRVVFHSFAKVQFLIWKHIWMMGWLMSWNTEAARREWLYKSFRHYLICSLQDQTRSHPETRIGGINTKEMSSNLISHPGSGCHRNPSYDWLHELRHPSAYKLQTLTFNLLCSTRGCVYSYFNAFVWGINWYHFEWGRFLSFCPL